MDLVFERERTTKNTVRFKEVVEPDATPTVGTLYVANADVAALGSPDKLLVTIEVE